MLFSHKSTALLHVQPEQLVWYSDKEDHKPVALDIPADIFHYLEVVDEAKAVELLDAFFAQSNIKTQRLVVILSDDVIFDIALPMTKDKDAHAEAQAFIEAIPLDPAAKVTLSTQQQQSLFVVGTNRQWLRLIVHAANKADIRIERIAPIGSYGISDAKKLAPHTIDQLLEPNKTAEVFNFLPLL